MFKYKNINIPSKVYSDATDASMGWNENAQEPVKTKAKADATDDYMGLNGDTQKPKETNAN